MQDGASSQETRKEQRQTLSTATTLQKFAVPVLPPCNHSLILCDLMMRSLTEKSLNMKKTPAGGEGAGAEAATRPQTASSLLRLFRHLLKLYWIFVPSLKHFLLDHKKDIFCTKITATSQGQLKIKLLSKTIN